MKNLISALALTLVSAASSATPVLFDINKSITQGGSSSDLAATTVALGSNVSLKLDPGGSGQFLDLQMIDGKMATSSSTALKIYGENSAVSASTIGTSSINEWGYAIYENTTTGGWTSSFNNGYLGFVSSAGQYGYINIDWIYNTSTKIGTLKLKDGAFESVAGTAIITKAASEVPEPASLALIFAGMLGVALARKRSA